MKKFSILLALLGLILSGCTSTTNFSMNYQRAIARTSGDLSTTVFLENRHEKISKEKIIEIAEIIKAYIEFADLESIDKDTLLMEIQTRITVESLKNLAYKIISKIPEGETAENSRRVMVEFLDGVITGAIKFNENDVIKKEEIE